MKTILIDLDDTIVQLQPEWYRQYNWTYGDAFRIELATEWNVSRLCKHGAKIFEVLERPGFFEFLPALPGALEGVKRLVDAGHRVLLVSSAPNPESMKGKALWLAKHMPWFDKNNLVLTHSKAAIVGDVLFDDGPHNIAAYKAAWPDAKVAAIAYPYNIHQLGLCDLVAGYYSRPRECWERFTDYVSKLDGGEALP